jgi:hypothetical protein
MFCTQCHVSYSWRTGALITRGPLHNPHRAEWARQQAALGRDAAPARNPADVVCGGIPDFASLRPALSRGAQMGDGMALSKFVRQAMHVQDVEVRLRRAELDAGGDFRRDADLRMQYLLNQLDEDAWRRRLQQREKRRERTRAVLQVHEMYAAAAGDILRGLEAQRLLVREALDQLRQLQAFTNDTLRAIGRRLNMAVRTLEPI